MRCLANLAFSFSVASAHLNVVLYKLSLKFDIDLSCKSCHLFSSYLASQVVADSAAETQVSRKWLALTRPSVILGFRFQV